jgi:hypothetical protein
MVAHPRAGTRPRPVPTEVIEVDSGTEDETKRPAHPPVIVVGDSDDDDDEHIIADPATAKITGPTAVAAPEKPAVVLSPEQKAVLDRVRAGENVFFTGSAGTLPATV